MSRLIVAFLIVTFSNLSFSSDEKVCKMLLAQAEDVCTDLICQSMEERGVECDEFENDFRMGHQLCVIDEQLPRLIANYNKLNPRATVSCDDI